MSTWFDSLRGKKDLRPTFSAYAQQPQHRLRQSARRQHVAPAQDRAGTVVTSVTSTASEHCASCATR
jgi:hypothetical protein